MIIASILSRGRIALLALFWVTAIAMPNMAAAQDLQTELDALGRAGGGTHRLSPGEQVSVRDGVIIPPGVVLDLNGGQLLAELQEANAAGVRLMSRSQLRNGTVTVRSRGTPASQTGAHAPVLIGALYSENAAPGQLSRFEAPSGWVVSNVTLSSDKMIVAHGTKLGAAGIQVVGGAHDGLIERVIIPDNARMAGGIMIDWGNVGPILSGDIAGSAMAYRAGSGYSTHPHDIDIRDIRIGRLTKAAKAENGSFGIRLSGVFDIRVSDVTIGEVTEAAFLHTAGDLGFEFAKAAERARAHRGITLDGLRVGRAGAYLVRSDSYADNIGRAAEEGYRPMLAPIATTDIVVRNVSGRASGKGTPGFGLRVDHQRGGTFADIAAAGFRRGFVIDEQVYDVDLVRPVAQDSAEAAIAVQHPYRPPARIRVSAPEVGGTGPGANLIVVGRSEGVALEQTGAARLRVTAEARAVRLPAGASVQRD